MPRNFQPTPTNMDKTFSTFHKVLSIVGISIFAKENWRSKKWLCLQIVNFIIGILCFIFTTGFVISNSSNLLLFIQGACIWATGAIMTITLGICLYFRVNFRKFLNEMAFQDHMLEMPLIKYAMKMENGESLIGLKKLVEESQEKLLKYTNLVMKTYVSGVAITATLYLCAPIFEMIQKRDNTLRLLAFDMWFPWSLEDIRVYIATFIFHAYCGFLCVIAYPGLQSIIILLVGQIIRQLRILTYILLHLNELGLEVTREDAKMWQLCCSAILGQCVVHYVKIKRFSNKLNIICRPFYLSLILVAIVLVCMCSVKIAISSKASADTMKYYIHEFCYTLVVLMFCALGQQVDNECQRLQEAVTEKWYIYVQKHKKSVLIFAMALSQRMPIYIFGTISLSLPTFTWFLKTGMSFFTMMISVLEQ